MHRDKPMQAGRLSLGTLLVFISLSIAAAAGTRSFLSTPQLTPPPQGAFTLGPVVLRDPHGATATNTWIEVRDGFIEAIRHDQGKSVATRNTLIIDGGGGFLAAGLIDMHVHYPPAFLPGLGDFVNALLLRHGVTTVRDMGSPWRDVYSMRDAILAGARAGPRIFTCGAILDGAPSSWPFATVVESTDEARRAVQLAARRGADCIKVYRDVSVEVLEAIAREAALHGLALVGHLPRKAGWGETRVSDIQHVCDPRCWSLREGAVRSLVKAAQVGDVAHTPTLVAFEGHSVLAGRSPAPLATRLLPRLWREIAWNRGVLETFGLASLQNPSGYEAVRRRVASAVGKLHAGGVPIYVGSDPVQPFVVPGASVHREMQLLVGAGMTLDEVWSSATAAAGRALAGGPLGRIEVGAPADLLLFRNDPRSDLGALGSLDLVIAAGRVYRVSELDRVLREQRDHFQSGVYRWVVEPALRGILEVAGRWR